MDTRELLGRISRLPIAAEGLATSMLSGGFRSAFRGQGMEFDEARHYQWGDDARSIDWNASTRLGTPFSKVFREERELSVFLILDASASMRSGMARPWGSAAAPGGGRRLSPYEQALVACALLAFSAQRSGQRVGALIFDRGVDRVFPPRKGRRAAMAFASAALRRGDPGSEAQARGLRARRRAGGAGGSEGASGAALGAAPRAGRAGQRPPPAGAAGSNIREAIAAAGRLLRRRSMVALASDFLSSGWEQELGRLSRRHDVVAIRAFDPAESSPPDIGLVWAADPETGARIAAPTGSASFREAWALWHAERADLWQKLCRRAGASPLELSVAADAAAVLSRFFAGRRQRQ